MAKRFLNHVCPWGTQNVLEADWMPGSQSDKRFFDFGNQLHVIKFIFSSVLRSSVINFRNATSVSFEWSGGRLFYLIKISFLLRSTGIHYLNNGNQLRGDVCHIKYNTPNWKPWKSIMITEFMFWHRSYKLISLVLKCGWNESLLNVQFIWNWN